MNHTTKTFPRTLNQAFGPHTSNQVEDDQPPTDWDGIVIVGGCIAAIAIVYAWLWSSI